MAPGLRSFVTVASSITLAVTLFGCSSGGNDTAPTPTPTTVLTRPTTPSTLDVSPPPVPTLPSEVPVPEIPDATGVPGVDSEVPFCRAYVVFVGTARVLGVAMAFGDLDPVAAALLEVVASPAVADAAEGVLLALPTELDGEQDVLAERVLGPLSRRADDAIVALREAGADDELLIRLAQVWLEILTTSDNTDYEVTLPEFDAETDRVIEAAADAFANRRVAMIDDPAMVRDDVSIPATDAFVDEWCPEARAVTVSDEI